MDTDRLRILVDAARLGSFAAAARARDIDPSSVSRVVAQTERELGVRIFQRTTRRLALTEAGEGFVTRVEAVLDELDHARDEAIRRTAGVGGTVRITTSVAFGLVCVTPLLSRFRQTYPELTVEVLMTDANVDLVRDRVDLAIRLAPAIEGDLICTKLRDTRYRVCASPDYLAKAPTLNRPDDLIKHDVLLLSLPDYRSRWLFRDPAGSVYEVPVRGRIVLSSVLALRDAARAGLGPVLLADWMVREDLDAGRLNDVIPGFEVTATAFETAAWIVYPSRAFLPQRVRATIDFLREHLGS